MKQFTCSTGTFAFVWYKQNRKWNQGIIHLLWCGTSYFGQIFIARKRSLGQGTCNIFTSVCHSVHKRAVRILLECILVHDFFVKVLLPINLELGEVPFVRHVCKWDIAPFIPTRSTPWQCPGFTIKSQRSPILLVRGIHTRSGSRSNEMAVISFMMAYFTRLGGCGWPLAPPPKHIHVNKLLLVIYYSD